MFEINTLRGAVDGKTESRVFGCESQLIPRNEVEHGADTFFASPARPIDQGNCGHFELQSWVNRGVFESQTAGKSALYTHSNGGM